jgi:DNA helicase-2/ATP-dependent DNA helicase PcrA
LPIRLFFQNLTHLQYRHGFSAICVDEAQDMNNAQYQLLKALANGEFNHILMVGDPNQSIFHFNGSSPK